MTQPNISLDLDSFVSNCLDEVANGVHKKKKTKKKGKKKKEIKLSELLIPAKKPLNFVQASPIQALVLLTINTQCSCCGAKYHAPNQFLFVKRINEKYGIVYEKLDNRLDLEAAVLAYPREIEVRDLAVQACPACFEMTDLLIQATERHTVQLDLFNS